MSRHAPARPRGPTARLRLPNLTTPEWQALLGLLLLGLIVRVIALRAPPVPVALNNWGAWSARLLALGPQRFYPGNNLADMGPVYVLLLGLIGLVAHPGTAASSVLYRLPSLICDLAIGAVVFVAVLHIWRPEDAERARLPVAASLAAAVWLLNPAAVLLTVMGGIESVYTLLLLLSVLLLDTGATLSLLCMVLALLVEPRTLELVPLVAIALIVRHGLRALLNPALAAVMLWCVVTIPFFGLDFIGGPFRALYASSAAYPYTAINALNIWAVGGSLHSDLIPIVPGLTPFTAGLLLYGAGIWYGIVLLQDQLQRRTEFLLLVSLIGAYLLFLPYAVLTRQQDGWLLPVLPFLLVFAFACLLRPARLRFIAAPIILYAVLSLFLLLDLYRVYVQNLYAPAAVPASMGVYWTIASSTAVWAVLSAWAFWAFAVLLPWWLPPGLFRRDSGEATLGRPSHPEVVAYDG